MGMLTLARVESILAAIPKLRIGVLGDLFLDRYLDLDARITEPSVETGLDAYQVFSVRNYPGAAGTVINNLASLGVGAIIPISVIGDDGEAVELSRALRALPAVRPERIFASPNRFTPTYTKPMLHEPGRPPRELNRIDTKNRGPLPRQEEDQMLDALDQIWPHLDALAVLDQVSETDCGVVTARVRDRLRQLGAARPEGVILADSRERIGLFENCWLKPNQRECLEAAEKKDVREAAVAIARRNGRPVFCTRGEAGILVVDPRETPPSIAEIPALSVDGPIDIVGAGDSTTAGILCVLAGGGSLEEAAAFGNLIASITIRQIGVTGTATPEQVRRFAAQP